ncbi:MAG: peptidoglycan-binding protein, partial [Clostridia bacterium]|nr:peptidoglycan-binding protein [Clostridia bacterium]
MDTLKAILNQILLFFDAIGERFRRLPARGRRRVFFLALIFLLLVVLLSILCISSCHREDAETVAEAVTLNARTRVRGTVEAQDAEEESGVRVSSDAHPVFSGSDPVVETSHATWAPGQSEPEEEPGNDEPVDEPEDEPEEEPEPTPEPTFEPEEEPTPEPSEEPEDEPVEETPEIVEPEETPQYAQLKKHDKSDAVTTLQYRLMELGYLDIDEPTNYFGSSTESALILFQRQHDLKQDGVAGNETQLLLYSDSAQH